MSHKKTRSGKIRLDPPSKSSSRRINTNDVIQIEPDNLSKSKLNLRFKLNFYDLISIIE